LESVLARALLRATQGVIRADLLDVEPSQSPPPSGKLGLERAMIEDAMRGARGNLTAAALKIGWSRQTLYRRIHALGLKTGGTKSSDSSTFQ
jgi:transcriptional regulator of acetoin/glycerol metabolism